MNKYSFQCTCGHVITVDAESREEGVQQIKDIMTEEAIAAHMAEKHQGEPAPSKEQADAMIEQMVKEGEIAGAPQAQM